MRKSLAETGDFPPGLKVVVYQRHKGVTDQESLREGEVLARMPGQVVIRYVPSFEVGVAAHISIFHTNPFAENYKRCFGDTGLSTQVYFATADEEI